MKKSNSFGIKNWLYTAAVLALFAGGFAAPTQVSASTDVPEVSVNADNDVLATDSIDEIADLESSVDEETVVEESVVSEDEALVTEEVVEEEEVVTEETVVEPATPETSTDTTTDTTATTDVPDYSKVGISVNDFEHSIFVDGDVFNLSDLIKYITDEYGVNHEEFNIWTYDDDGNVVYLSDSNIWFISLTVPDIDAGTFPSFVIVIDLGTLDLGKAGEYAVNYYVLSPDTIQDFENLADLSDLSPLTPAATSMVKITDPTVVVTPEVKPVAKDNNVVATKEGEKVLPNTGEASSSALMSVLALIAFAGAAFLAYGNKKRN